MSNEKELSILKTVNAFDTEEDSPRKTKEKKPKQYVESENLKKLRKDIKSDIGVKIRKKN